MSQDANQPSADEAKQIEYIAQEWCKQNSDSPEKAEEMMRGLASAAQNDPGIKFVHMGNVLFMTMVRGKGVVEAHPLSIETDSMKFAKDIVNYVKYLKAIDVKFVYTYADAKDFLPVARRTRLPFKHKKINSKEMGEVTSFYLEIK